MVNHQQRTLTDGRMKNSAVGSVNSKLGANQSNYLVTNDGLQTMDLPRNILGPRQPESNNGRQTPLLISPVKYIVYNNPQVVYDFLISKGYNVDNKIPSVYQFTRMFIKENGDPGILELVRMAHPDKDTFLKAIAAEKKESNYGGTEMQNPVTPSVENKTEAKTEPKSDNKAEEWIKLNTKTIIIILAIIVFFLLINRTSKA